jgi:hypothetical protein
MDPTATFNQQFECQIWRESMNIQGNGTPGRPWFKIVRPNGEDKIKITSQS